MKHYEKIVFFMGGFSFPEEVLQDIPIVFFNYVFKSTFLSERDIKKENENIFCDRAFPAKHHRHFSVH